LRYCRFPPSASLSRRTEFPRNMHGLQLSKTLPHLPCPSAPQNGTRYLASCCPLRASFLDFQRKGNSSAQSLWGISFRTDRPRSALAEVCTVPLDCCLMVDGFAHPLLVEVGTLHCRGVGRVLGHDDWGDDWGGEVGSEDYGSEHADKTPCPHPGPPLSHLTPLVDTDTCLQDGGAGVRAWQPQGGAYGTWPLNWNLTLLTPR
jgi:hypothetical protein